MIRLATALMFFCICIANNTSGQDDKKHKFQRFGFTVGANYSTMKFNKAFPFEATSGKIKARPGFLAGFILRVPLNDKLTLQPEYIYSQRSSEVQNSHTIYNLSYFSTPVLLKYHIADRVAVVAGPQLDLLLKATQKTGSTSKDIIHETEERSLGVTAGVAYKVTELLQVEAQYYHGLSHIGIENNATEFSYRVFRLNASLNF